MVITGVLGAGVVTTVGQIGRTGNLPSSRIGFGVFIALVLLLLLAEASPELAAGFATLMLLTALFVEGGPLWDTLSKDTKPSLISSGTPAGGTGSTTGNLAAGIAGLGGAAVLTTPAQVAPLIGAGGVTVGGTPSIGSGGAVVGAYATTPGE